LVLIWLNYGSSPGSALVPDYHHFSYCIPNIPWPIFTAGARDDRKIPWSMARWNSPERSAEVPRTKLVIVACSLKPKIEARHTHHFPDRRGPLTHHLAVPTQPGQLSNTTYSMCGRTESVRIRNLPKFRRGLPDRIFGTCNCRPGAFFGHNRRKYCFWDFWYLNFCAVRWTSFKPK
jgi:hypothetical protein